MPHILFAQTEPISGFDLESLRQSAISVLVEKGPGFVGNFVAGLAILLVGLWVARVAAGILNRILTRAKLDETLSKFLGRLAQALIAAIVIMAALDRVGIDTTSFAAILAAAGLAIGLALQGSLSNFAAGIMIIIFRPFKVGDFIEAAGTSGIVEEIHIFHTLMRTGDNIQVVVPNGSITNGNIRNFSAKPQRRIDLLVGCGYQDDLRAVKQFLNDLLAVDSRILSDPEPVVAVSELGDHCVNFVVRPWVANADYWKVRWDLTEAIKIGFDERGFHIPYPQQDVHIHRIDQASETKTPVRELLEKPSDHTVESLNPTPELGVTQFDTSEPMTHGLAGLIQPRRAD